MSKNAKDVSLTQCSSSVVRVTLVATELLEGIVHVHPHSLEHVHLAPDFPALHGLLNTLTLCPQTSSTPTCHQDRFVTSLSSISNWLVVQLRKHTIMLTHLAQQLMADIFFSYLLIHACSFRAKKEENSLTKGR